MKPHPVHRLPAPLEAATHRLRLAAREAAERTIESLGLAALACSSAYERDGLLGAQFELNRKSAVFTLTFNEAFDERVLRELGATAARSGDGPAPSGATAAAATASAALPWDQLKLVDDREVEAQISAERFGMEIAHACEWELRELNGYVASLLAAPGAREKAPGDRDANPLRPEVVGHALVRAVEAVSDRADTRRTLVTELQRSLSSLLRTAYGEIVADLRRAGVQPLGLSVRMPRPPGGDTHGGHTTGYGSTGHGTGMDSLGAAGARPSLHGAMRGAQGYAPSLRGALGGGQPLPQGAYGAYGPTSHRGSGTTLGAVDPALMTLIRRLAYADPEPAAPSAWGPGEGAGYAAAPLPNLIRAHRDELRQASTGKLDHMVIDVIGSLFDQILSDPKVPPQMARQIARLQLPVLRAALGDPAFFSSRRHPVRRFINRIASLGAAFEDMAEDSTQRLMAKVRALVQEVVEGDFDQIELYESKLAALEAFVAELARGELLAQGDAPEVLAAKEDQLRLRQVYAQRLEDELGALAGPEFLRQFMGRVWSQVLVRAAELEGEQGPRVQRWRRVGRDLFISVQPKATPAQRKAFLAELPQLMQELTEGLNLIAWPQSRRNAFFAQLMPAHAEALKAPGLRALDLNLMARQVEGALQRPLPSRDELRALSHAALPVLTDAIDPVAAAPVFSAEEARRVGLVDEASVDWNGQVDIDLSVSATSQGAAAPAEAARAAAEAEAAEAAEASTAAPLAPGLPAPTAAELAEPTGGAALVDALQLGCAYRMHLQGQWQKVRLAHVSDARSFFAFTHGGRHQQTVSMTRRMLTRMCETGRLKPYESAYLLERATARARRQLASLGAGAR
jgi:hypothetical protein